LSHNAFTGNIPAELGGVTALESLDLSCNQLSGEIPQELTDLTFLDVLNLSDNHLVGKIPQSRQFSTFDSNSFEGNAGLCGPPLSNLPCGASPHTPFPTWASPEFHYLSNEITQFTSLPRRKFTYYSIFNMEPVTQGPLTPQHANSSLKKPSKDSIPSIHIAKEKNYSICSRLMTTAEEAKLHCRPLQHLDLGENEAPLPSSPLLLLPMPALYLHPSVNLPNRSARMRQDK
jgi:hypothetical protein